MTPSIHKFSIESVLELLPDCEVAIEYNGFLEMETEVYGDDADGRRGEVQTSIKEVTITQLWAYFPGRPALCLANHPTEVLNWLTREENGLLIELACERVFMEEEED